MFTLDSVRKFHCWTHASLKLVLDHLSTIPTTDYVRELPGFGFRTLREQAIHIFNCEGFWIHTLRGKRYADRTIGEYFPDGDVAVRTPALVLHHVLTHAFHHKGQIVAMCRTFGHPAPDTDLNQFE